MNKLWRVWLLAILWCGGWWSAFAQTPKPAAQRKFALIARGKQISLALALAFCGVPMITVARSQECRVQPVDYKGWKAQQVSNTWVKLTIVPQLGGRLMQVEFDGHPYLFVNPKFEGKYIPPEQAARKWINYGGDKIWPMPEGNEDEAHWVLESATLDDRPYAFKVLEQGARCTVELAGPADATTGLQYTRQITLEARSPAIHFHAVMHNATLHTLEWSVQSVSQYSLASAKPSGGYNHQFWAYTAANANSAYLGRFHVRSGLSDDPSFSVKNELFRLHWMYLQNEVWVDSPGGWLAVADGESGFGMIERFRFEPAATYPDKATVIFYKNGPAVEFNAAGDPEIQSRKLEDTPYYMEAEINSPLLTLDAGASASLDTTWFPLRTGAEVKRVMEAGIVTQRLHVERNQSGLKLSGTFGVVAAGRLQLRIYDRSGRDAQRVDMDEVGPEHEVTLNRSIATAFPVSRVAVHLVDATGGDWGILDEASVEESDKEN